MKVTHAQKMEFYKKGYVRVPGVVPSVMVDAAVKAINHSLSSPNTKEASQLVKPK